MNRFNLSGAFVLAGVLLSGCVYSTTSPTHHWRYSGDYSQYQKIDDQTSIYFSPTKRVVDYGQFFFERVLVYPNPVHKIKDVSESEFEALGEMFRHRAMEAFEGQATLVDKPGPGVLRIQIAILDIKPGNFVRREDGTEIYQRDTTVKGTRFDVDCTDSSTGERIAALTSVKVGADYKPQPGLANLNEIQTAFDQWLQLLKTMFEKARHLEK